MTTEAMTVQSEDPDHGVVSLGYLFSSIIIQLIDFQLYSTSAVTRGK